MKNYVVTVKREARTEVATNWIEDLRKVEGVGEVRGNARRAILLVKPESISKVEAALGPNFWIEPEAEYKILA